MAIVIKPKIVLLTPATKLLKNVQNYKSIKTKSLENLTRILPLGF